MKLSEILKSSNKSIKRVGRGTGSGHGKTSGRGHNGQNSRTGGGTRPGFEGGQMPLVQRLPKQRGFKARGKKETVNIKTLEQKVAGGETITKDFLFEKGIIKSKKAFIKVVGKPQGKKFKMLIPVSSSLSEMKMEKKKPEAEKTEEDK